MEPAKITLAAALAAAACRPAAAQEHGTPGERSLARASRAAEALSGLAAASPAWAAPPPVLAVPVRAPAEKGEERRGPPTASVGRVRSSLGTCSGTPVGPRVVLTAGHCGSGEAQFMAGGGTWTVRLAQAPNWRRNDIGIGISTVDIRGVTPWTIGGAPPRVDDGIDFYGHGRDALLGQSTVTAVGDTQIDAEGGVVAREGDSGGPVTARGGRAIVGVVSMGVRGTTTVITRTDSKATQAFLSTSAAALEVEIQGVTDRK